MMPIPDYEYQARDDAKVLGSRLVRAVLNEHSALYGWVEFAHWSGASPDGLERRYWYEVRFKPLGTRWRETWTSESPSSDAQVNRLHFSVLERTAAHPKGPGSAAKLGPIGHIRTEPKSVGLGTYLRDQLIDWVASLHPEAPVVQGSLSPVDAGADNLKRRNRFYESGKFQIRVQDDGSGAFWADRLDGLRRRTDEGNVIELAKHDVQHLLRCVPEVESANVRVEELIGENTRLRTAMAKAQVRSFWAYLSAASLLVGLLIATSQGKLSWHLF
jgi:hypothetical protein